MPIICYSSLHLQFVLFKNINERADTGEIYDSYHVKETLHKSHFHQ